MNARYIHVWLARQAPQRPAWVVFVMSPEAGVSFSVVVSCGHGCPSQRHARELKLIMSPEDVSLLSPPDLAPLMVPPWEVPRARHMQWSAEPVASQLIRD